MTLTGGLLKTIGEKENAGNQHILLSPQCFLPFERKILPLNLSHINFDNFSVFKCIQLTESKILSPKKELDMLQTKIVPVALY